MKNLVKIFAFGILFSMYTNIVKANEIWACNALTSSRDGSKLSPFVMKGNGTEYSWRGEYKKFLIKKVGENGVSGFEIFVDKIDTNSHRKAFYLKKEKERIKMKMFNWNMPHFFTECFKQ